ncbi:MAG: DUF2470 domain-containing protein [Pseudomonadota bacterium]
MDTPINTAKDSLRRARQATLSCAETQVPLATDQRGHPLMVIPEGQEPEPGAEVTLSLGPLTLTGMLLPLTEGDKEEQARFEAYHPPLAKAPLWRMRLHKADMDGKDLDPLELLSADLPDLARREAGAVEHMNEDHADAVALYATHYLGLPEGHWVMQGLDPDGLDMALGDRVERLTFEPPLTDATDMGPRLVTLAKEARAATEG